MSDGNGSILIFDCRAGYGQTLQAARAFIEEYTNPDISWTVISNPPWAAEDQFGTAHEPPRVAEFLLLLIPIKYRENLLGDLEEEYRTRLLPRYGLRKAQVYYCAQVLFSIGAFLARSLAGIAGIHWVGKIVEHISGKLLK